MPISRARVLSALGIAATCALAGTVYTQIAQSQGPVPMLPDLVSQAPPSGSVYLIDGEFTDPVTGDPRVTDQGGEPEEGAANRLLLRFDGWVDNRGDGPVHFQGKPGPIKASERGPGDATMKQWVKAADGSWITNTGIAPPTYTGDLLNDAEGTNDCVDVPGQVPASPQGTKPVHGPCFIFSTTDSARLSDGHNHWHLVGAAEYSLWNAEGDAMVAPGQKAGFCLYDFDKIPWPDWKDPHPARYYGFDGDTGNFCRYNNRNPQVLVEGINRGYRDVYESELAWQWIDVSNVAPGRYRLGGQVDPFNRIWEKNENNPVAKSGADVVIPGWMPVAPPAVATANGAPVDVTLGATALGGETCQMPPWGNPDLPNPCTTNNGAPYTPTVNNRRFVVTALPASGTLVTTAGAPIAANDPFPSETVRYVPKVGVGNVADAFQYAVYDSASKYPLTRTSVSVPILLGNPAASSVTISGNPASIDVNAQVDLDATTTGTTDEVVWSVDGVAGGNTTSGTITPAGVYTAPPVLPAGGAVTVGAHLANTPTVGSQARIGITKPPAPQPQPLPRVTVARTKAPAVARIGRSLVVRFTPPSNGSLTVAVAVNYKAVRTCTNRKGTAGTARVCVKRVPRTCRMVRTATGRRMACKPKQVTKTCRFRQAVKGRDVTCRMSLGSARRVRLLGAARITVVHVDRATGKAKRLVVRKARV